MREGEKINKTFIDISGQVPKNIIKHSKRLAKLKKNVTKYIYIKKRKT